MGGDAGSELTVQQKHATTFISTWQSLAVMTVENSPYYYFLNTYGDQTGFSLGYNLYADLLLDTNLVPTLVSGDAVNVISRSLNLVSRS